MLAALLALSTTTKVTLTLDASRGVSVVRDLMSRSKATVPTIVSVTSVKATSTRTSQTKIAARSATLVSTPHLPAHRLLALLALPALLVSECHASQARHTSLCQALLSASK